jgi:hypothetical protein
MSNAQTDRSQELLIKTTLDHTSRPNLVGRGSIKDLGAFSGEIPLNIRLAENDTKESKKTTKKTSLTSDDSLMRDDSKRQPGDSEPQEQAASQATRAHNFTGRFGEILPPTPKPETQKEYWTK